jgi:NADPH-dependent 7-cyano-7-deazaguanine reductase QueF
VKVNVRSRATNLARKLVISIKRCDLLFFTERYYASSTAALWLWENINAYERKPDMRRIEPLFKMIPNVAQISRLLYSPTFSAVCEIGHAPFHGLIEIEYWPNEWLLEFESFESWLRSIAMQQTTIEGMARLTFDQLSAALGDIRLRVTVYAQTTVHAPVEATIERS